MLRLVAEPADILAPRVSAELRQGAGEVRGLWGVEGRGEDGGGGRVVEGVEVGERAKMKLFHSWWPIVYRKVG